MRLAAASLMLVAALLGGYRKSGVPRWSAFAATPEPLLSTREGPALRVGPPGSEHFVGMLANGEGAFGVAVAVDGAFLAFTCGMAARADVWFSGDWYRGRLTAEEPATVPGPDGEHLTLFVAPTVASRVNWLDPRANEYPQKRPLPARSMGSSDATTRMVSSGLSRCPAILSALSSARATDASSRPGHTVLR